MKNAKSVKHARSLKSESYRKKFHVRRGDVVRVIAGDDRGKTGKILRLIVEKDRVIVEGINLIKKAVRPNQGNPQGGIVEKEGSIHISNVKKVNKEEAPASK